MEKHLTLDYERGLWAPALHREAEGDRGGLGAGKLTGVCGAELTTQWRGWGRCTGHWLRLLSPKGPPIRLLTPSTPGLDHDRRGKLAGLMYSTAQGIQSVIL